MINSLATRLYVIIFCSLNCHAQFQLEKSLIEEGFENIHVESSAFYDNKELIIHYENRKYRFESDALYTVLSLINSTFLKKETGSQTINNNGTNISIIILNQGVPVSKLKTNASSLKELFDEKITYGEWEKVSEFKFSKDSRTLSNSMESSKFKADIEIGTNISYLLGNFNNPIRWAPKIESHLKTQISKGLLLKGRYDFLIYDDLFNWENSRFTSLFLTQSFNLNNNLFANISAGYFRNTQKGIDLRLVKFFFNDILRLELNSSLSQNYYLDPPKAVGKAIEENHFQYGVTTIFRHPKLLTDVKFNWGKFLYDDIGYNFQVSRQFKEVEIGFYLVDTTMPIIGSYGVILDKSYGFYFKAPFGTKKHMDPKRIRIKTKERFYLNYNYVGGVSAGNRLETNNNLIDELWEYYPSTLRTSLKLNFSN